MTDQRHTLHLGGCAPVPLADYLKALGILRLVSEQVDSLAQGWWENDKFFLRSRLDAVELHQFFLEKYSPTPLVGPWGARSGFFPSSSEKSAREALEKISSSTDDRLDFFRKAISKTKEILSYLGLAEKADNDEDKLKLLHACRSMYDDAMLAWTDAVYVLLNDNRAFPPLLGTGGNEGSGSYMSGFAQQVVSVLIERKWDHGLEASLYCNNAANIYDKQTPGHFSPNAAGGPNAASGFEGSVGLNPWDYLLALEGTLIFAASAVKQLEDRSEGALAYPFCVRASGLGYASSDISDEALSRAEMWFPLWEKPTTISEINMLFGEGKVTVNYKKAKNGLDFARSIATIGIDRGINCFKRYGFQQRNGLSFFAIPLNDFHVRNDASPLASMIDRLDSWLDRFRRAATGKNASGRAGRVLRRLESAIFDLCQQGRRSDVQSVLIALGEAEATVAISRQLRENLSPVPLLDLQWLTESNDGTPEFRLAASLASIVHKKMGPLRRHLEPLDPKLWTLRHNPKWAAEANDPAVVWGGGDLVRNLNLVLKRRLIQALQQGKEPDERQLGMPMKGRCVAALGDVADFIEGNVDDERIESLLRGLMLLNWSSRESIPPLTGPCEPQPTAAYALLKLCHLPEPLGESGIKLSPGILQRAFAGDGAGATQLAARRLRVSGYPPAMPLISVTGSKIRRIAAALAFPISKESAQWLAKSILRPTDDDDDENRHSANASSEAPEVTH